MGIGHKKYQDKISYSPQNWRNELEINKLRENGLKTGTKSGQTFSSQFSIDTGNREEKKLCMVKSYVTPYYDYTPARVSWGKEPFIYYYVMDPISSKLKRIRVKISHIPVRERKRSAMMMVGELNSKLSLGWNPLLCGGSAKSFERLFDCFQKFLQVKTKELERNSIRCYVSYDKSFREWLLKMGINDDSPVYSVDDGMAKRYMNSIDVNPKISATTYNNYLRFHKLQFNWLLDNGMIESNPFESIAKKPKRLTKKTRRLFTDDELSRMITYLSAENYPFLCACMLCNVCLLRPKEIMLLKCRDIDLKNRVVHVKAEVAKNDNESFRTIPDELIPVLSRLDFTHPDWYMFGKNGNYIFKPSKIPECSRILDNYWARFVRPACSFPEELQFYSLKDTGITNMLTAGIPINAVQKQADHSSVAITAIYVGKTAKVNQELVSLEIPKRKASR